MPTCVLTEIAKRAAGGLTFKACLFPFPNSNQTHFRHSFRPDMVARIQYINVKIQKCIWDT